MPRDAGPIHLPSDLAGLKTATFFSNRQNLQAALGPACAEIALEITSLGLLRQEMNDKANISNAWQTLMSKASRSIRIFSGDASWASRDTAVLQELLSRGVKVRALCEQPGTNEIVKTNIQRLIGANLHLRYYSAVTSVRGIVVDKNENLEGFALLVRKFSKTAAQHIEGLPGRPDLYDYKAKYYFPQDSRDQIEMVAALFDLLYAAGLDAFVLNPAKVPLDVMAGILARSGIPQYSTVTPQHLTLQTLTLAELWSACRFVKNERLNLIRPLVLAYNNQNIDRFAPACCLSCRQHTVLLPPIVEKHDDKYVVIDGMHRLYTHLILNRETSASCIVVSCGQSLPSQPLPLGQVSAVPSKRPRAENFPQYREEQFRPIKKLDSFLHDLYHSQSDSHIVLPS